MKTYEHIKAKLIEACDKQGYGRAFIEMKIEPEFVMSDEQVQDFGLEPPTEQKKEDQYFHCLAMKLCLQAHAERVSNVTSAMVQRAESPIEKVFFLALHSVANSLSAEVRYAVFEGEPEKLEAPMRLTIQPQVEIGKYRIDFKITWEEWLYDFVNGEAVSTYATKSVLVECDGHDFHERTKEQAKRDRSKDRLLQEMDYKVLRFTGSEIWADPIRCAEEVLRHVRPKQVTA